MVGVAYDEPLLLSNVRYDRYEICCMVGWECRECSLLCSTQTETEWRHAGLAVEIPGFTLKLKSL